MARSDLLRALLTAWSAGDDNRFLTTAEQVIDDERRKGHVLMARELETALRDPRRPGARDVLSMRPVPNGRDDRPLLSLSKARFEFGDLVLAETTAGAVADVVRENLNRRLLATHALRPRQRLLLVGPPGTGKTATAHAIAAELSLPVATANLAALTSSYLGETARNVEAVVRFADTTPCVLLLDEFDALATERSQPGDHGELRRVVATILQVLDESRGESLVIATSNHAQMLDSAIWRRFDEVIRLDPPDAAALRRLVALKLQVMHVRADLDAWADQLAGVSAAGVELVCRDALRLAVLEGTETVIDRHLRVAVARLHARAVAIEPNRPAVPKTRRGTHSSRDERPL